MTRVDTLSPLEARVRALEMQHREACRLLAELQARDALKTQFLANISHDLRTPLTAIVTHAEILRDGIVGDLSQRQLESVHGIISGGRQLLGMVGEILTYARGQANQLELELTDVDIAETIAQTATLNEALVSRKPLLLSTDVEPGLPTIQADREKVTHILGNLLGNAISFTPPNGRVWISARLAHNESVPEVLVEVGDSGIGIAPEHHALIFQEFAQVDSSPSRSHHGTGLGLTIARRLVELHGGRIWLESAPDEGSRFFFTLPVRARG